MRHRMGIGRKKRKGCFERNRILKSCLASLMPEHVTVSGFNAAFAYKPLHDQCQVGGDFFDTFPLQDGGCGVIIGDVSGKGQDSIQRSVPARFTLRSFLGDTKSCSQSLEKANIQLCSQLTGREKGFYFLTAMVGIVDHEGNFTYANAGHPTGIVHRGSGTTEFLEECGLPLCVQETHYESHCCRLASGDKLVLYSDGLTDMAGFDAEGVIEVVRRYGGGSPELLLDKLLTPDKDIPCWRRHRDDITVIVLEKR